MPIFFQTTYPCVQDHDHKIELEPIAQPTVRTQWRLTQPELDKLRRQLDYLLEKGFVHPSTSQFAAPILFTPKIDGGLRVTINRLHSNSSNFFRLHLRFFELRILTVRLSSSPTLATWPLAQYYYKTSATASNPSPTSHES
ncbi:hypothetical protein CLOM_g6971 [Closterium sp. NIES-68]|nr:hypothetical protein CLOM_g6971 [Closterium sp. NIES-68]